MLPEPSPVYLAGGHVCDPAQGLDGLADVLIADGRVVGVGPAGALLGQRQALERRAGPARVVTLSPTHVVAPGFVDLHTHAQAVAGADGESLASLAAAAAAGGFTTVCCLPDLQPAIDSPAGIEHLRQAARGASARVHPIAAITRGTGGTELTELTELAGAGAVAFSDGDRSVGDSRLMRSALEYSLLLDRPMVAHCQDERLAGDSLMHEGPISVLLGLKGWPSAGEEIPLARDVAVARQTGGRYHAAHLSTAEGVAIVRRARAEGLRVTAAVTPHHLLLTDAWVAGERTGPLADALAALGLPVGLGERYDTQSKVNPPLRAAADATALLEALLDGTIDAIATDHTPRSSVEKACEFGDAAFGISGLETALPALLALVHAGRLPLTALVAALAERPARAFGLVGGTLEVGAPADVVIFDPAEQWTVDPSRFASRGHNTPLAGLTLRGRVRMTLLGGVTVYDAAHEGREASGVGAAQACPVS